MAEFAGTGALLVAVVGSGVMAERLSAGNTGLALLANALVTGLALYVLITILRPASGAHFNPLITIHAWKSREIAGSDAVRYMLAQWGGAVAGVWLAHIMFDLPVLQLSSHARASAGQLVSEAVAAAGLVVTVAGFVRQAPLQLPAAVGAYIAGAYWFTASTSFANPAVTTARALTDTFAGIDPAHVPAFIAAQLAGLVIGAGAIRLLLGPAGSDRAS